MKQQSIYAKAKSVVLMTFALCTFVVVSSMAQGRFSVGAELALPQGDINDAIGAGFGVTARYEAPINDNLSWMGTAGFLTFGEKDDSGVKATIIPINAGIKYYFNGESFTGFYGGAELGLNFASVKIDAIDETDSETKFGFAPQIGYHLPVIDISLRYSIIDDIDYLGLRVAYVFGGN
ncbi:MAG TPA: outer membrane beta-barrel protein [Ohtaekwangia sp.]|nr:outer membrane beta-barrel protein [Ohtaekwangia sp.]